MWTRFYYLTGNLVTQNSYCIKKFTLTEFKPDISKNKYKPSAKVISAKYLRKYWKSNFPKTVRSWRESHQFSIFLTLTKGKNVEIMKKIKFVRTNKFF